MPGAGVPQCQPGGRKREVGLCGVAAKIFLQPSSQRLELGHKTHALAPSRGQVCLMNPQPGARENPFCPQPHLHSQGSPVSRGQGQALPITLLIWTPLPAWGWGRAMAPTFTAPLVPGGTDIQHGGGGGRCQVPPFRAGPVPRAHAALENLQVAGGEVRHPPIPPSDRAKEGGGVQGKEPLQASQGTFLARTGGSPRGQEPGRWRRWSMYRCGPEAGLYKKPAGRQG